MVFNLIGKNIFCVFLFVFVGTNAIGETQDQQTKVALRTIGHQFLLSLGDSTSRVLPIQKIEGRYAVQFEKNFSFEPDLLFHEVFNYIEDTKSTQCYIVEVEKCGTLEVMHSFKAGLKMDKNLIACKGRLLPLDCYTFYFTLVENAKPLTTEKKSSFYWPFLFIGLLPIGLAFLILKKRNQKVNSGLITIGKYQFDPKGMNLILEKNSKELSSKESDLLLLLYAHESKTLEREHILHVVWGDEGNYVGRTLDVFISKLRKKLEADPNIKIINVRGIGYRFVVG